MSGKKTPKLSNTGQAFFSKYSQTFQVKESLISLPFRDACGTQKRLTFNRKNRVPFR